MENGTATIPGLVANTGTASLLQLEGGTMTVTNANVNNGAVTTLGNGAGTTLTYKMAESTGPRVHTFAGGLTIATDGRLEGAATIVGNVQNNGIMAFGPNTGTTPRVMKIVGTLGIGANATTDINNNAMIVTGTPVGTYTGSAYTDVTGMIASGRGTGTWNGTSGIITTQSDATTSNFTSIGVASAQEVVALASATDTGVWAGQTVTGSDTLVLYTYGGDANLDGKINVDDYGKIDFGIGIGLTGWYNGDFNYDGKVNVDDYGIIDFNVGIQGAPFPTASGAGGSGGVSAVPEPASPILLLASGLLSRFVRRRRN
jgi:hypothetical protein